MFWSVISNEMLNTTVWLEIFEYLIFEDRHAVLAPPTSNFKLTTPFAQQLGNLLAYNPCNLTVEATPCSAAHLPISAFSSGESLESQYH